MAVFRDFQSPYDVARLNVINGPNLRTFPFLYPPPSLLLLRPLAALTLDEAKVAVTAVNHLIVFFLVLLMPIAVFKLSPRERCWSFSLCLLYPLFSYPLIYTVRYGQINVVLLAALVGFWFAAQRGKSAIARFFLCLAVLCKTYPVIIVPMLLAIGRWRESLYTIGFLGVVSCVAALVLPSEVWHDWLFSVAPSGSYMREPIGLFPPSEIWNQSLNGLIARRVSTVGWLESAESRHLLGQVLCWGAVGTTSIVSLFAVRAARRSKDAVNVMMPVALPLTFLVAPFSWEHHGAYLIPAILFLLSYQMRRRGFARIAFSVLAGATAITLAVGSLMFYRFSTVVSLWILSLWMALESSRECVDRPA